MLVAAKLLFLHFTLYPINNKENMQFFEKCMYAIPRNFISMCVCVLCRFIWCDVDGIITSTQSTLN